MGVDISLWHGKDLVTEPSFNQERFGSDIGDFRSWSHFLDPLSGTDIREVFSLGERDEPVRPDWQKVKVRAELALHTYLSHPDPVHEYQQRMRKAFDRDPVNGEALKNALNRVTRFDADQFELRLRRMVETAEYVLAQPDPENYTIFHG